MIKPVTRRSNFIGGGERSGSDRPAIDISFDDAVKIFIDEQKIRNRSPRTIDWHKENFHAVKKAFNEQKLQLAIPLSPQAVKKNLILYCQEKLGNSPKTINMRLRSLKLLHTFLVREEILDSNPLQKVELLSTPKLLIQSLSDEQIQTLLRGPNRRTFTGLRDYTIMLLLLETGLRVSEIASIRLEDINLKEGYIKVMGKGAKERTVPIQSKFVKALKIYLHHRGSLVTDTLFVTLNNKPLKVRSIQEQLKNISAKAGITQMRTSPHIWRHTFARKYIVNGGDVFSLKRIMGHSDWHMVHHYTNLFSSDVAKQHEKFSPLQNMLLPRR